MIKCVKGTVSILSVLLMLFYILSRAGQLAIPEDFDSNVWASYYAEKDNTINTVLIGSSAMYRYWLPTRAYEEQGFTSALLATAGQDIRLIPYTMEETVKSQDVDLFVVEIRSAITRGNIEEVGSEKLNYRLEIFATGMKPSMTKFRMIQNLYDADESKKIELMFPILMFHDNLLQYDKEEILDRMDEKTDEYKMTRQKATLKAKKRPKLKASSERYLTDEILGYVDDIEKKADELGVDVLLISTPFVANEKQGAMQLELDAYLDEQGYTYIDFNSGDDVIGLDYSTDFFDGRHTNVAGAKKFTSYMAKYLKENYNLKAELDGEAEKSWADACEAWSLEEEEMMAQWRKSVEGK